MVKAQALKIAKLEHQLAGHNRHWFGCRSESMEQLLLTLEEEEQDELKELQVRHSSRTARG